MNAASTISHCVSEDLLRLAKVREDGHADADDELDWNEVPDGMKVDARVERSIRRALARVGGRSPKDLDAILQHFADWLLDMAQCECGSPISRTIALQAATHQSGPQMVLMIDRYLLLGEFERAFLVDDFAATAGRRYEKRAVISAVNLHALESFVTKPAFWFRPVFL